MVAFTTRMNAGFPGQITRDPSTMVIETELLDGTSPPTAFGQFVKTVSGKLQPLATSDAASLITGLLVRSYPSQSTTNAFGSAAPIAGTTGNRLRRGYAAVICAYGTPAVDGIVYVRNVATGGVRTGGAVGDIEATSDAGYNVVVTGARWNGSGLDSNNVAELAYNQ